MFFVVHGLDIKCNQKRTFKIFKDFNERIILYVLIVRKFLRSSQSVTKNRSKPFIDINLSIHMQHAVMNYYLFNVNI